MAKRFTDEFEVTGDAPGVAVDAAFLAWWERLRADYDSDGKINTAEFLAGIRHAFLSQDRADPGTELLGNA